MKIFFSPKVLYLGKACGIIYLTLDLEAAMFNEIESVELLREIRNYLSEISNKLDSIDESLEDIKGSGIYNIDDLHSELIDIRLAVEDM